MATRGRGRVDSSDSDSSDYGDTISNSGVETCTAVKKVSFAEEMNARYRATMEDAYVIQDKFCGKETSAYFGVYDGHGGRDVAEFLRTNLHETVAAKLAEGDGPLPDGAGSAGADAEEKRDGDGDGDADGDARPTPTRTELALTCGFIEADMKFGEVGHPSAGSTACVCILDQAGANKVLYTANCGDARAVLCSDGRATRLSKDHKASDEEEKKRIEAAGGFVIRKRVMGVLAVARSFGDYALKKFVPAEPYTSCHKLDSRAQFIILACDGIWDVLEDQEAVDIVRENEGASSNRVAKILVDAAISKGSTDNITALVIFL